MQRLLTPVLLMVFLLSGLFSTAQTTIFVKILDQDGTQLIGESIAARHTNEIIATSFGQENTGCATNTSGGGSGACGGTAGHFIFNMGINQSLTYLKKALFTGTAMKSADITFMKQTGSSTVDYYKIHLDNVYITHVTNSVDNSLQPVFQVELDAAKITWTNSYQKPDGSYTPVSFGWDVLLKKSF